MGIGAAIGASALIGAGSSYYAKKQTKKQMKKAEEQAQKIKNEQNAEMERRNQRIKEIRTRMFNVGEETNINTNSNKIYGN